MYCWVTYSGPSGFKRGHKTDRMKRTSNRKRCEAFKAPTPFYPPSMRSLILTHLSCSQSPLCQAAFMFNEECRRSREMQRITLCSYELPALRTQRFLLLLWSAMFRCIFKNKTDTELCLAPWGNCSLLLPNRQFSAAGNRQPGVSSNIGFEMKGMQTKGTEERRGGRKTVQRHWKKAGEKMKTEGEEKNLSPD